jgi:hypothetical protein
MWKTLEELRQKPEFEKRSIALIAAAVFSGIIFIGWLFTLPFTARSISDAATDLQTATPIQTITGQVDLFRDTVGTLKNLEE